MEVEAAVFYWTPYGMSRRPYGDYPTSYITKMEAERLCAEAHKRGFESGVAKAEAEIRQTPIRPG